MTVQRADLNEADPTTWHQLWTAPFRAIRATYWALDKDAKVRARGVLTQGQVISTRTEKHEDSEGGTTTSHYVKYQYQAHDRVHTTEKGVGNLKKFGKGKTIGVYYLVENGKLRSALEL